MSMTVTNVDLGNCIYKDVQYQDDLITFGGAGTLAEGTILARDSVSGKLVPYVKGGSTNENGIPKAVVTYDVTAAGSGDVAARVAIKGEFFKEHLIINADGDASNIDNPVLDALRLYGLYAISAVELNIQDNQ